MKHINLLQAPFIYGGRKFESGCSLLNPANMLKESFSPRSGGIRIHFISSATKFKLEYKIKNRIYGNYPHVGINAQFGLAIMYRVSENWYPIDCTSCIQNQGSITIEMWRFLEKKETYEIMIFAPILSYLCELIMEVDSEEDVFAAQNLEQKKILFLGGMNTYGIGCTSAGVISSNILARRGWLTYNFAYADVNYSNKCFFSLPALFEEIQNLDYVVFEGDYIRQEISVSEKYFYEIVNLIKRREIPLIIWSASNLRFPLDSSITTHSNVHVETNTVHQDGMHSPNFMNDFGNILLSTSLINIIQQGDT